MPPDDPSALAGFPSHALSARKRLFRVVREGYGPWWFGSSLEGRFDLREPEGTCYVASDAIAALLEVVGADRLGGIIPREFLEKRRLRELRLPRDHSLSDLTSRKASRFGITAEIGTIVPYELPQKWAARLRQAGSEGLIYRVRHDPAGAEGFALFGPRGERTDWKQGRERSISDLLIRRLSEESGLAVVPIPRADQLRILGE